LNNSSSSKKKKKKKTMIKYLVKCTIITDQINEIIMRRVMKKERKEKKERIELNRNHYFLIKLKRK
jgi:hypothetical protein